MALFDSIIDEVAQKFGLGDKASSLMSALLSLMTNENSGGLTGFIDRFRQAGLGDLVSSWISTGSNQPLTDNQLQSALGGNTISNLASKAGIAGTLASSALAFMIPKVIDFLTPNGTVPSGIPSSVSAFLAGGSHLASSASAAAASGSSGLMKILPLLLLALLAFLGYRYCNRPPEMAQTAVLMATPSPMVVATPAMATLPAALGTFIDKVLPDGVTLKIPSLGVESKLLAFIEDAGKKVDKTTWFSFDRLEFDTDKATLKPGSQAQLNDIAAILKAYPKVHLKIGGYTDNVGKDDYNMKLSTERAANTMAEIAKLGIDKTRLASEGYGKEHPVADNATEEGRARNRRIDLRVTQK